MFKSPDYLERRINLAIQRREHRAERPVGCECFDCRPDLDPCEVILARAARARELIGEPPF